MDLILPNYIALERRGARVAMIFIVSLAFHFISLHFISLHFISFHCISFDCISFHFIAFHFISLHFIALHCIVLYCIAYIAVYCIVLYCIVLYCIVLYCIVLRSSILYVLCRHQSRGPRVCRRLHPECGLATGAHVSPLLHLQGKLLCQHNNQ